MEGKFHGCGHDGHTTSLLAAAKRLSETRNFSGTVHLIFQPAEELLYGGRVMLDDGLFDQFPCDAIFAFHNGPGAPTGLFLFREGVSMAAADTVKVHIKGKSSHGAMPEHGIDANVIASHIVVALQTIVSRNVIRIPIESRNLLDSIRLKGVGKDTDFAIWMHRRCSSDCAGI
ncbi:M20/M25/M40 family metallo-hydrolase [Deinococcus sp. VB142]|uniref:M20/M25/M40 family metallo-hydrolase n=1 Tax=Deinococcus sp. VB142 TaxID=3112952 RepID=A0AAU6Q0N0_9DEIO